MLTAVVLIGRRLLLGPLIATVMILTQEKFLSMGGYADKIILGGVLIATLAFFPRGLIGFAKPLSQGVRRMMGRAPQSTP